MRAKSKRRVVVPATIAARAAVPFATGQYNPSTNGTRSPAKSTSKARVRSIPASGTRTAKKIPTSVIGTITMRGTKRSLSRYP